MHFDQVPVSHASVPLALGRPVFFVERHNLDRDSGLPFAAHSQPAVHLARSAFTDKLTQLVVLLRLARIEQLTKRLSLVLAAVEAVACRVDCS